jgi:hypothetical protein
MVNNDGLVHPVRDSTELLIRRTINGILRMISLHNNEGEKENGITAKEPVIEISLAAKRHWELEIKILRETPRDPEKLREILKVKQEEYEKVVDSEVIERLIPEIGIYEFVLFLVCRNLKNISYYSSYDSIISRRDLISYLFESRELLISHVFHPVQHNDNT